jgi:P-type conjugative transfer protein TrbJ
MWSPCSMPLPPRSPRNRRCGLAIGLAVVAVLAAAPSYAQQVVYDPRNHLENALQAARQLESLANEARSLAASSYSHLAGSNQSMRDMAELARSARGLAASVEGVERQFQSLYADDVTDADLSRLLEQSQARSAAARRTAEDVARTAAELERLGAGRSSRLSGALAASEAATGQTAAIQSTNQLLAVLAEDMAALRTIMLAQSRLLAEQTARETADRTAGAEARRQRWGGTAASPAAPAFDPFSRARN